MAKNQIMPYEPLATTAIAFNDAQKRLLLNELGDTIRKGMQASKTTYITHQGQVKSTMIDIDHMARLRASELAAQVIGLRQAEKQPIVTVQVNVVTPDWAVAGGEQTRGGGVKKRSGQERLDSP